MSTCPPLCTASKLVKAQSCSESLSSCLIKPLQNALGKDDSWSQGITTSLKEKLIKPLSKLEMNADSHETLSSLSSLLIQKTDQLAKGKLKFHFSSQRGLLTLKLQEGEKVIFSQKGVQRSQKGFFELKEFLGALEEIEKELELAIKAYEDKYRGENNHFSGFVSPPQVLQQIKEARQKVEIFLMRSSHIDWAGESFYDSLLDLLHFTGIATFISHCFKAFAPKPEAMDTNQKLLTRQGFLPFVHEQLYGYFQSVAEHEGKEIGPSLVKGILKSCMNFFISSEFIEKDQFFSVYTDEKQRNLLVVQMLKALEEDRFDHFTEHQLLIFGWFLFTEGQGLLEALKSEGRAGLIYNVVYKVLDMYQSLYIRQWLTVQSRGLDQVEKSTWAHSLQFITSFSGFSPIDFLDPIFNSFKNYVALVAVGFFEEQYQESRDVKEEKV